MANRREFLAAGGGLGMAAWGLAGTAAGASTQGGRMLYELRHFHVSSAEQKEAVLAFLRDAAIPALNRLGIEPVGVFIPKEGEGPITALLPISSPELAISWIHRLGDDEDFLRKGADFLDRPADNPAYDRMESSLLLAFTGMPSLERPVENPGRVFQLRIYESPTVKTGQKKIEMFNDAGEIALFRKVGLHPVFFGEALIGSKMPNLTYMLGFESEDQLQANWKAFVSDPGWLELKAMPEYADKAILSGITNTVLNPADCSQI